MSGPPPMGLEGGALQTEEPPPSFEESGRMLWKVTSLRRVFYSLPFLAASIIGFASLAALLYQHAFGLGTVQRRDPEREDGSCAA